MPDYQAKIDKYDTIIQGYKLLLITISFILMSVGVYQVFAVGHKIDLNVINTQQIIQDNQRSTIEARKSNIARQKDLKSYVECIILVGKTHPELNFATATLAQTKAILDECAAQQ